MNDHDNDSQMLSSSSASPESESMFPSANSPSTPHNFFTDTQSPLRGSELSPPDSLDAFVQNGFLYTDDAMEVEIGGDGGVVLGGGASGGFGIIGGTEEVGIAEMAGLGSPKDEEMGEMGQKEPGWAWKNKKAQIDYYRAMEQVIDKGFNLREFGDLFDDRSDVGAG